MLLAIDAGNTETKLGVFGQGDKRPRQMWRVTTESRRTADEYGVFLTQLFVTHGLESSDVGNVIISSVVPRLDQTLADATSRFFHCDPVFLRPSRQTIMPIRTERPGEVGADLIAVAIGAASLYAPPLIVISFGTATAFVAVSEQREFLGTAIAPGIAISVDALVARAAKLPQIALRAPKHAIGRDTIASLQSGIVFGYVGQTEALIDRMSSEMGGAATVVATGGLADVVARHSKKIAHVDPHLSLIGLRRVFEAISQEV